jgi:hypothetical protein
MARERVQFQVFRGTFASWQTLFSDAAEFATRMGRGRVISISHSEDRNEGVVTVWYWSAEPGDEPREPADDFIRVDEDAVEWRPGQQQGPQ